MDKHDMVTTVANLTGCPKDKAKMAVDAIFNEISAHLAQGNEITVHGFGKFERTTTAPGKGRNPRTGEEFERPAGYRAKFKAAKALKDQLAAGYR